MKKAKGYKESERQALKALLYEKTGYMIRSNNLLEQIFTRSTYTAQNGGENNEVLEFLGDQVLSYYLVKAVAGRFGDWSESGEHAFQIRENRFTAIKQDIVRNETLREIIDSWGIAEYVIAGRSDWPDGLDDQPKVRADLFEAILGAIALESNWDSEILDTAVNKMLSLDARLEEIVRVEQRKKIFSLNSAVSVLETLAEEGQYSLPEYTFTGPDILGDDENGNPQWRCACRITVQNKQIIRTVTDINKGGAKKAAAYLVLCAHFGAYNKYGPETDDLYWIWKDGKLLPSHSDVS